MSDIADKQILKNQLLLLLEAYYHASFSRSNDLQKEIQSTKELLKMYEDL